MTKKVIICGIFILALVVGCLYYGRTEAPEGEAYQLYFLARDLDSSSGDGALQAETVYLQEKTTSDTQKTAMALVDGLLKGPRVSYLARTVPEGTLINSLEVEGGRVLLDVTSEYLGASGVELTLADYAITLTLTQIPDILSVKITVDGKELPYRDRQVLTSYDIHLSPQGDIVGTVEAVLYFLDRDHQLVGEKQELDLYEGNTQVMTVVSALEDNPEDKDLQSPFPEGFHVKSVWLEEDICYVNLPTGLLDGMTIGSGISQAITSLGKSLCSLDIVEETRFLVDGEYATTYGFTDVSKPFVG